ncbi:zinc knuckle CX2CX4HX4C containing protein [Tanacetum coccineum]
MVIFDWGEEAKIKASWTNRNLGRRIVLEEDLEDHVLMLREKEQMVKKLRKYLMVGALSPKGRGSGNGVKEKNSSSTNVPSKDKDHVSISFGEPSRKYVNFRTLFALAGNGVDRTLPSPWSCSKDGMYAMIENGMRLIRNVPLILKKWTPDANVMIEDVCNIPIWVKSHDIPITAFTEDEVTEQGTKKRKSGHVKMIVRKRPRPQPDDDSDDEHRKYLRIVTFEGTIYSEIMETKSFITKLHKVSSPDGNYLVIYRVKGHFMAFNYLMEVLHIFDRHDLFHLYDLVMKQYSEITPEDIELILWGDLKIMMESLIEENDPGNFWNNQQEWEIFRWRLYEDYGVCILELKDETIIHMLVERRYHLSKELLQKMLDLELEVEEESTAALQLDQTVSVGVELSILATTLNRLERSILIGIYTITKGAVDSNPYSFDAAENILMNDKGVGVVSTHNHVVGGLNSNRELGHEAFNTMPSVEVVAEFFGMSLKTPVDIDNFTRDIEKGIYESTSYAGAAGASTKDQPKVNSNFRPLVVDPVFDGVNISIPRKVVENVSTQFEHTLYGYFIGKRMAFPVVEYCARNNWAKNRLKRIMMNAKGFFFFKFDTRDGLEAVLEGGPWMIRKSSIILKKWSMDTSLLKEELTRIPIWVKLHDVPIQVFEEDGISLIATFIGKHVMLDSYISSMCNDSWGRNNFARCLIEVNSKASLVDVITIGIPSLTGRDSPKKPFELSMSGGRPVQQAGTKGSVTPSGVTSNSEQTNDGFQIVGKKKKKGKSKSTNGGQFGGHSVKQTVRYEPKANTTVPKKGVSNTSSTSKSPSLSKNQTSKVTVPSSLEDNIVMSNSYAALDEESDEDVENVYDESANLLHSTQTGGSSSTSTVFFSLAAVTGCISVIVNMTFPDPPMDCVIDNINGLSVKGGLTASRSFYFGPTYVVEPKGEHQATIVWLHGLGDDGSSWSQLLETLPLPNIKWICPTSPAQPFTLFGGFSTTAWFDVIDMSEDSRQDLEGMDASAAHVLSLLSTEPSNIKLGVVGFSMGAATALHSASCYACGKFGNGSGYPTHLDVVVALSGWLPCANDKVEGYEVENRPCHVELAKQEGDGVVQFRYGVKSAEKLTSAGFENLTFKPFNSLGHTIIPEEMDEVSSWLASKLVLEAGSR